MAILEPTSAILYGIPSLALILAAFQIAQLFARRSKWQKMLASFPGPEPHWWYGNTDQISGDFEGLLQTVKHANDYSGIFPVWTGPFNVTLLSIHPVTARTILSGTDPKDAFSYALLGPWMGEGLLLQSGRKWERTRRLLTPAFHTEILKTYMSVFGQCVQEMTNKWRKAHGPVEIFHYVSLMTMDSMLRCLFGHDSQCQKVSARHPYIQSVYDLSHLTVKRLSNPLLLYDFIYSLTADGKKFKEATDSIHSFSRKIIKDRQKVMTKEKPSERDLDFLDILLLAKDSDGHGLTDQEIQDEVDTFMFAGHDSTASSLSWCLYNLASNPHCQEACRKEAKEVMEGKDSLDWDDLRKLDMISACIHESMRLYPAVPSVSRFTEREICLSDGRVIPKGIRVAVSFFALHRNPELWNDPDTFDPNRFLDGNESGATLHMPFSVGPRNCIGKSFALTQLKTAVANIVLNFNLRIVPERPPKPESTLVLRCKDGLYLNVTPL